MSKQKLIFWFTGFSGSGKTTIANKLETHLKKLNYKVKILDGDDVRNTLHKDLGFTKKDILLNNELISKLALEHIKDNDIILVPIISPYTESRTSARKLLGDTFVELYIKADINGCIKRDVKGLYKKALAGEIDNFIGISKSAPYELPENPNITLNTDKISINEAVQKILSYIKIFSTLSKETKESIIAAKKGGTAILKHYTPNKTTNYELKHDNTEVTKADLESNNIIIAHLKQKFQYDIISEEQNSQKDIANETVWLIDPLDGTKDFISGSEEFSVMISLIKNNEPHIGVVYLPAKQMCYFAEHNKGSFLETEKEIIKLHVSNTKKISDLKLVLSKNHFSDKDKSFTSNLKAKNHIHMGSIGVKLGEIASGNADLYFNFHGLRKWDIAAPQIIVEEANGIVSDIHNNELNYTMKGNMLINGILAINAKNHEFLTYLKKFLMDYK
jgi:3'(2'),5'-bisphosphate nucleotidase